MTVVDVMLPHYGPLELVQETIRSVLAQDDPAWRLTVVDDSGEAAGDTLGRWCAGLRDERVRYLRNPRNLGINRNFGRCVELVEHDLAVLVGSDDLMLPNYVRTVRAAFAAHPEVAVVQPGVQVVGPDGRPVRTLVDLAKRWVFAPRGAGVLGGEALAASLLRGNWLYFPSLCWRSGPLRRTGFRPGLQVVQDLALVLDLLLAGERLLVVEDTAFRYRRHDASVSSAHAADGRRFAEERGFFLDTAARLDAHGWPHAALAARRHLGSRLNALTRLPGALRAGAGAGPLARHAFSR